MEQFHWRIHVDEIGKRKVDLGINSVLYFITITPYTIILEDALIVGKRLVSQHTNYRGGSKEYACMYVWSQI